MLGTSFTVAFQVLQPWKPSILFAGSQRVVPSLLLVPRPRLHVSRPCVLSSQLEPLLANRNKNRSGILAT